MRRSLCDINLIGQVLTDAEPLAQGLNIVKKPWA
jgi:hypothetical protein